MHESAYCKILFTRVLIRITILLQYHFNITIMFFSECYTFHTVCCWYHLSIGSWWKHDHSNPCMMVIVMIRMIMMLTIMVMMKIMIQERQINAINVSINFSLLALWPFEQIHCSRGFLHHQALLPSLTSFTLLIPTPTFSCWALVPRALFLPFCPNSHLRPG